MTATYTGLYRWFCHMTYSPEQAADLTQETFAAFWESSKRRGPGISPTTWLYAIGRNLGRAAARPQTSRVRDAGPDRGRRSLGRARAQDREFAEAVGLAVAELSPDLREAFTLRFWNEFGFEQVGAVQGVEPGLARWHYFAARRRLQDALAAWAPHREQQGLEDHHAKSREP